MKFIDAHCHLNSRSKAKMELALERGAAFVSINTDIPFFEPLAAQESVVLDLKQAYPDQVRYMGSFESKGFGSASWQTKTLDRIKQTVDNGASGIKIWKNFGMAIKDDTGQFVMVDDERLDPVFDFMAQNGLPMIGHIGEPKNCWLPLEEMTVDSDRRYFSNHSDYHMYLHPEYPSYQAHIDARDAVLSKHPSLIFVGAHLGSLEWNLDEVALRLDKFPNFHTDLAERVCHVQLQSIADREKVRQFFIKYQDRIIYGSDVIDFNYRTEHQVASRFEFLWDYHLKYFGSSEILTAEEFEGSFQGLDLPQEVIQKIFITNAANIYGFKI
ncbi:amidohydrolase family protein [Mongoliitalea daihaiensis]|uniref:amidohydrolase family protein n=1 Tax=Mongoliitalea daihaiensis TaxID=2782006 RepID=UPI001F37F495|nr:amidohydrolase family protein [Mongoliitalea daihaiensis]